MNFETEVLIHYDKVWKTAFKMIGDKQNVDDLVQETFMKAFIAWSRFDPNRGATTFTWLIQIMKNMFLREIENHKNRPEMLELEDNLNFTERLSDNPIQSLKCRTGVMRIRNAINNLPKKLRDSVEWLAKGFSYEEIAEILNRPCGSVKSNIHIARDLLRKGLCNKR